MEFFGVSTKEMEKRGFGKPRDFQTNKKSNTVWKLWLADRQ